jgi:hypothetical protein
MDGDVAACSYPRRELGPWRFRAVRRRSRGGVDVPSCTCMMSNESTAAVEIGGGNPEGLLDTMGWIRLSLTWTTDGLGERDSPPIIAVWVVM